MSDNTSDNSWVRDNSGWIEAGIHICILLVIFIIGIGIGGGARRATMQRNAIQAGVGRFVIANTNTGTTQFEWVTNSVGK